MMNELVTIAQGFIGFKESDGSHKKIVDVYNRINPLPVGYKLKYTDAWCAGFVSACAFLAGMNTFPFECSCSRMIELLKKKALWEEKDSVIPFPGDLIFYDWQDKANYANYDNMGSPDHVGIIEKVNNGTVTIIEGNYSNSVKRRTIKINGRYIRGFGKTSLLAPAEKPTKYINYTVKKGDTLWMIAKTYMGNGARYREIMSYNGLSSTIIYVGQNLKIPK